MPFKVASRVIILELSLPKKKEKMKAESVFSERVEEVKHQYLETFDPRHYHRTFYSYLDEEVKFFLRRYHEIFTNGRECGRKMM